MRQLARATRAIPGLSTPPGFRRVAGNWVPQLYSRRIAGLGGRAFASGTVRGTLVASGGGGGGSVTVTSATPSLGSAIGDTVVIAGTGFTAGQAVTIGGQSVASPTFDSSVQITATIPAGVSAGLVAVSVAGVSLNDAFTVYAAGNIVSNASFETGWDGFHNASFADPTATRDSTRAKVGSWSAYRSLPTTSGSDVSVSFTAGFYDNTFGFTPDRRTDRLYGRFYFYVTNAMDGTLKLCIHFAPGYGTHIGGFYFNGGYLAWNFIAEWSSQGHNLKALSELTGAWHSIEYDLKRNGDTYPNIAIWLDDVQLTAGIGSPPSPGAWSDGRLDAGERLSSAQIGVVSLMGVLNGSPNNTVASEIWQDRISLSTVGRIGP